MSCFRPRHYVIQADPETGRRRRVTGTMKCGDCFACRMAYKRSWAIRCIHEATLHDVNWFATLTYSDTNHPLGGTLVKRDLQLFHKRLRTYLHARQMGDVRYFAAGEYGERTQRPHYHDLLFGLRLTDMHRLGQHTWTSDTLRDLWGQGNITLGLLTPERAAYTAGYAAKKVRGRKAHRWYHGRQPEFNMMSLKPAIGRGWADKYKRDCRHGFLIDNGTKVPVPRYYRDLYRAAADEHELEQLELEQRDLRDPAEETTERLTVRELVAQAGYDLRHSERKL